MKSFFRTLLALIASAALTFPSPDARAEDLAVAPDPAFASGLATLKQATGFVEQSSDEVLNEWRPHLQLWVGVKAVEGKKQTLYYVQLTTLSPPLTNADGQVWQPVLRTNDWSWPGTNKNVAPKRAQFISPLYPVRARVFDATGQALKEAERSTIVQALRDAGGRQTEAARTLGIDRSTLRRKVRRLGINPSRPDR